MERVSFEVAKYIKKIGYPQGYMADQRILPTYYGKNGKILKLPLPSGDTITYHAPFYFEVWLWLWREKRKSISIIFNGDSWESSENCEDNEDLEAAVIAAIEYLVTNDLIK